ncbi:probable WRKY transcription factor protein 1 [Saccostrea cucullata]|uniref:probable WRKY transcription factor protein 1 n=1 Tax=Saccostrea cuccullata TaxID=36930 RepID=UPI002ED08F7B
MTSRYSDISLNTDKDSTRRNVYNTEENKPVEMNTQTHEILRNKSQEKNTQVEKLSQQEGVDAPKENNDNENVRRLKKRNHKPNSDPRNLQSSSKGTSIKKSGQQNINYQTNSSNRNISEQKPALRENTYPIPGQIPSHQNTAQTNLLSQSVPNEDLSTNTKTPPKHSTEETCKERREDSKNKNTCNDNKSSTGKQGEENQIKGKGKNRNGDESVQRNMSNLNIHPNTSGINAENDLDVNKNKNRSTTFKYNDHGLSRGPNSMPALGPQGYQRETPKSNESTSPNNDDTNGQFSQENKTNKGPINTDKEGNREVNEGMRAKRYIPEQKSVLQDNKAHYFPGSISSHRTRAKSDFLSKSLSLPYGIRQPRTQDISAKDDLDFVKKMSPTFSNYNYDLYGASNSNSALISFGNKKKSSKNNGRASPRNDDTHRQISQEHKTNIGPIDTDKEGNREVNEEMRAKRYIPEQKPASHVNKVHTFPGSISSHLTSASSDFLSKSLSFLPYENRHPRTQDITAKDDLDVVQKISPTFRNDSNSNPALISFGNKKKSPNNNDRASHSNDGSNKQFPQENYSVSGPTRNDKESNGEFNEGMSASKGSASEDTKGEAFE